MPWDRVGRFTVGDVLRPGTLTRKQVKGPPAVRVATTYEGVRCHAPSLLVAASGPAATDRAPSYELYDATRPTELVCALTAENSGARYRVTAADGAELGFVHRTPTAKRAVQHGWWLRQPGHEDIVARYKWARGSAKDIAVRGRDTVVRGAGAVVGGVVDSVLSLGAEGDARTPASSDGRPVDWRAEGEDEPVALTSEYLEGLRTYFLRAHWLDRRLAFALAVLRES